MISTIANKSNIIKDKFLPFFSMNSFKEFFNNDSTGLFFPFKDKVYNDEVLIEYKKLKVNNNVNSINRQMLPDEFCDETCRLIDEFRRKTATESIEWMLYIDYVNGIPLYCWKGESGKIIGNFNRTFLQNKHIVSIHNHCENFIHFHH